MNWTSTKVPKWQIECGNFANNGKTFELRDVTTNEHQRFVELFAKHYSLAAEQEGTTVTFSRLKR